VKFIEKKDDMAHLGDPLYDWNLMMMMMMIGQYWLSSSLALLFFMSILPTSANSMLAA
jgi:hypothetical protein